MAQDAGLSHFEQLSLSEGALDSKFRPGSVLTHTQCWCDHGPMRPAREDRVSSREWTCRTLPAPPASPEVLCASLRGSPCGPARVREV